MNSIKKNKRRFDGSLKIAYALYKGGYIEESAHHAQQLAYFSWGNCTGYYANWKLEALLNNIGESLSQNKVDTNKKKGKRRVLHVASELLEIGGHTRLLFNWIKNDNNTEHVVVLTRQQKKDLPIKLLSKVFLSEDLFVYLDEKSICGKSIELREMAQAFDFVVLHIHPDDVVPVIAFSHRNTVPPVLFVNHADHIFWIGVSIADAILQIRESSLSLDKKRRGAGTQFLLPIITQDQKAVTENEYAAAREKLGVQEGRLILLTTGTEYKYKPKRDYNFYEAIFEIANRNSNVDIYVVGVEPQAEFAKKYVHPQIFYKGYLNSIDLSFHEDACDVYLEGFPLSSFTALLQPALKGKPVQFMYNPLSLTRLFEDNDSAGISYPSNLEAWNKQLELMIKDAAYRLELRNKQYAYLSNEYSTEKWKNRLEEIYESTKDNPHQVKKAKYDISFETKDEVLLASLDFKSQLNYLSYIKKLPVKNQIVQSIRYILK